MQGRGEPSVVPGLPGLGGQELDGVDELVGGNAPQSREPYH